MIKKCSMRLIEYQVIAAEFQPKLIRYYCGKVDLYTYINLSRRAEWFLFVRSSYVCRKEVARSYKVKFGILVVGYGTIADMVLVGSCQ